MKILLCPDKFKGSLSANDVCRAIGKGLQKNNPKASIHFHPMADGGDGSLEVLTGHLHVRPQTVVTTDPLGRKISAQYFTSATAVFIEMASASGLVLLSQKERNPLETSTLGTGRMMADAIAKGYRNIYLFLGGSATNDAGMGIATALGCRFLDKNNQPVQPTGSNLSEVQSVQLSHLYDFSTIKMTLLCDVTNPLFGPIGAAQVYARQKGATDEQIGFLDQGLRHFNHVLRTQFGVDVNKLPGSGAAGGIGASLCALFGAKLQSGFTTISELTGLEKQIQAADWVISGEGKLDRQSLQGKVIDGVAKLCLKYRKPLTLFVGKNDLSEQDIRKLGIRQVLSIAERAKDLEDAMQNGANYLEEMALGIS